MPVVTISSTGHQTIDIDAIANFEDDIKIGKRKYSKKNTVYVKSLRFDVHGNAWKDLYSVAKHIEGDCEKSTCKYCRLSKKRG
jgi:hypothetical protein